MFRQTTSRLGNNTSNDKFQSSKDQARFFPEQDNAQGGGAGLEFLAAQGLPSTKLRKCSWSGNDAGVSELWILSLIWHLDFDILHIGSALFF
jgi:hypothetical protein